MPTKISVAVIATIEASAQHHGATRVVPLSRGRRQASAAAANAAATTSASQTAAGYDSTNVTN